MLIISHVHTANPEPSDEECKILLQRVDVLLGKWVDLTPPEVHMMIVHLLKHFPDQFRRWGAYYWMYPYERSADSSIDINAERDTATVIVGDYNCERVPISFLSITAFLRFIGWLVSLVKGKNLVEAELISKFTVNASARYLYLAMTLFSVQCISYTNSSICRYYLGIMDTASVEDDENWKKWQTKRAKSARRHKKDHQSKMSQGLSFDSGTWI
jgi:hypothetical protein